MRQHSARHKEPLHKCSLCDKAYHAPAFLKYHMQLKHFINRQNFSCNYCDYTSPRTTAVKAHTIKHHTKNFSLTCKSCNAGFTRNAELQQHIETNHKGLTYFCNICKKQFKSRYNLVQHKQVHQANRSTYNCEQCEKKFIKKASLQNHMLSHDNSSKNHILCELCGKSFTQKDYLRIHQRIHTNKKNFTCERCGKMFYSTQHLKIHILSHTKEKPYKCHLCDKSYSQSNNLLIHKRRLHSGEKPYKCENCCKAFVIKALLRKHNCRGK